MSCTLETRKTSRRADDELKASADSVLEELSAHPERLRARLFADLFARLLPKEAPTLLLSGRTSVLEDIEQSRAEGVAYIASALWRRMIQLESLDAARGSALATVLCELIPSSVVLFYFEHEARTRGLVLAAERFAEALDRRFPEFRVTSEKARITRAVLEDAGIDLSKLDADFYASGQLRSLARRGPKAGAPVLELEDLPGRGRYGETGRQGGYGFMVNERYEDGYAQGTFFSPWHDGEDYRTEKPWLVWVLENASEIARE